MILSLYFLFGLHRKTRYGLSFISCCSIHQFLLRWTEISRIFCWYRDSLPRLYTHLDSIFIRFLLHNFRILNMTFSSHISICLFICLNCIMFIIEITNGFFVSIFFRINWILAWHYCDIDGRQATFLCPNGTQFSQAVFVCDWWFNVNCELSPHLYEINARLYQKPKVNPTQPHRLITKDLIDSIFN